MMIWQCGVILERNPCSGQAKRICKRESLFESVTHLRPTKAHLALELERARQPASPPPAGKPGSTDPDHQDHPNSGWVEDLHHKSQDPDQRKDFGVQADSRLHRLIIDYMLKSPS